MSNELNVKKSDFGDDAECYRHLRLMESKTLLVSLPLLVIALCALARAWRAIKDEHHHRSDGKRDPGEYHR